jgi:hypothetical protein
VVKIKNTTISGKKSPPGGKGKKIGTLKTQKS